MFSLNFYKLIYITKKQDSVCNNTYEKVSI